MVSASATSHGIFLESSPTGCRFSGVENLRAGSFDGINELCCQRRHTGQTLDKVEGYPLGAQDGASLARDFHYRFISVCALAILDQTFDLDVSGNLPESCFRESDAGDDQSFASAHARARHRILRH